MTLQHLTVHGIVKKKNSHCSAPAWRGSQKIGKCEKLRENCGKLRKIAELRKNAKKCGPQFPPPPCLGARGFAQGDGVADFDGLLPRSLGGGEGLRVQGGGESALGMAKEIDSTLHCRFTTFTASWKYSKWSKPSGANPTTMAGTRIPLERM